MGCVCCGCRSALICANCSDGTPSNFFVSVSGLTFPISGACNILSGCSIGLIQSFQVTYTAQQDTSFCLGNQASGGTGNCMWGCNSSVSLPLTNGVVDEWTDTLCSTGAVSVATLTSASFTIQKTGATTWQVHYYSGAFAYFRGSATVDSGCAQVNTSFSNDLVLGQCITIPCLGTTQIIPIATGGTVNISIKKSCCP